MAKTDNRATLEVFRVPGGKWLWRSRGADGKVMCVGKKPAADSSDAELNAMQQVDAMRRMLKLRVLNRTIKV